MAEPDDPPKPPAAPKGKVAAKDEREARLAAALRTNLRRRKAADREPRSD